MSINSVENFYIAYFGRAADPAGLSYWLDQEAAGVGDLSIAAAFAVQPEALALYPQLNSPSLAGGATQANFLNAVYMNLFGHAGDPAGLTYWEGQLSAGVSLGQIIAAIISGAQAADITALANKSAVATAYTNAVQAASPAVAFGASDITQSRQILAGVTAGSAVSASSSAIAAAITSDQHGSGGATTSSGGGGGGGGSGGDGGVTTIGVISQIGPPFDFPISLGGGGQALAPGFGIQTFNGTLGGFASNTATASQLTSDDTIDGSNDIDSGVNLVTVVSVLDNEATVQPILKDVGEAYLAPALASQTFSGASSSGITTVFLADDPFGEQAADGEAPLGSTLTITGIPTSVAVGMANVAPTSGPQDNLIVEFTGLSATTTNTATLELAQNNAGTSGDIVDFAPASNGAGINVLNIHTELSQLNPFGAGDSIVLGRGEQSSLTTINVSGNSGLVLVNTLTSLSTYNGQMNFGTQTVTFGALSGPATINGGSGGDTLDASLATGAVTMTDGGGSDTLMLNGGVAGNKVTVGFPGYILGDGSGGPNVVRFDEQLGFGGLAFIGGADLSNDVQLTNDLNVLSGYAAGNIQIDLHPSVSTVFNLDTTLNPTKLANAINGAGNNLLTVLNGIADLIATQTPAPTGGTGAGVAQVVAFAFNGDEYIFQDNHPAAKALAIDDGVLKVTGAAPTFSVKDLVFS